MTKKKSIYRVLFVNHGGIYEIYAKSISQDSLYGFIEVSDLIFGHTSNVLVDPGEERLKKEFNSVEKTHIPVHAVIRIDEVEKEGTPKVKASSHTTEKTNIATFPSLTNILSDKL